MQDNHHLLIPKTIKKYMTSVNTIQLIDSLGEITRHRDREIIEKSLLKTLGELAPNQEFRLFKVMPKETEKVALGLLAYSINDRVETSGFQAGRFEIEPTIKQLMLNVIGSKDIEHALDDNGNLSQIIYPALDRHNEVSAILVHVCGDGFEATMQRIVYGLLKVYSNYLALIEDNQRDKLTQLLNRDTMDKEITRILLRNNELRVAQASGASMKRLKDHMTYWLGILDIDHFKAVNDTFGHLFGDDVLILVARHMQQSIDGEEDLLYRYGGEEFVIILRANNIDDANQTLDRLRSNIEQHDFPQIGRVTVSMGMVQITDQSGSTEIIGQADQALYYAKEHGRNQVCCYETLLQNSLIKAAEQNVGNGEMEFF